MPWPSIPPLADAKEEERIKATIPSLQHYKASRWCLNLNYVALTSMQVTPYWTNGNVGVEMKAMAGMKKKEVPTHQNPRQAQVLKLLK